MLIGGPMDVLVQRLLNSSEPSIRFLILTRVLRRKLTANELRKIRSEIKSSSRIRKLLSGRTKDGRIPHHPYSKWNGAHWVLASLADIGYPPGDRSLLPLRESVYDWILPEPDLRPSSRSRARLLDGRVRICGSMDGNVLYSLQALGLVDSRIDILAERLIRFQWPDGGWNCDKRPAASKSSFMETLIPLRGLSLFAKRTGDKKAKRAADKAADVFLRRRLFQKLSSGRVIHHDFVKLHYPCYWHYDILFGLKVMAEAGYIRDPRCNDALDLLESKRLPDGGFPAETKYYHVSAKAKSGRSLVDWGGISKRSMNEFVTADALYVMKEAGRAS